MPINNITIRQPNLGLRMQVKANFSNNVAKKVEQVMPSAVDEFYSRANKKGQFLNWVDLPQKQTKRVDNIYDMVNKLKNQTAAKVLTVLGIGGSKHTVEHMLGINGLNIKGDKVKFYSDIDSTSFARYMNQIDNDVTNSNYLVVSKSGSTFETKDGMMRVLSKLKERFDDGWLFSSEIQKKIAAYMVAVTDKNDTTSELRRYSNENGWLGDLYIHDDVGGRFSAFDDHVLFTLAYAGMKKEDMIKMLQSAQDVSNLSLSKNLDQNQAVNQAAFWSAARLDGVKDSVHMYLGEMFNSTEKWHAQMQNESVKDTSKQIAKITDAMHHSSEAWYKPGNKFAFAVTAPYDKGPAKENVEGYVNAIEKTNADCGPSMLELVNVEGLGLTPEAAGAMTQTRAFSTVYQEIIEKKALGQPLPKVLDSVLQPNVETYKKNLKPTEGNQPPVEAGRSSKA